MFSIKVSRSDLVKLYQYREKGGIPVKSAPSQIGLKMKVKSAPKIKIKKE